MTNEKKGTNKKATGRGPRSLRVSLDRFAPADAIAAAVAASGGSVKANVIRAHVIDAANRALDKVQAQLNPHVIARDILADRLARMEADRKAAADATGLTGEPV